VSRCCVVCRDLVAEGSRPGGRCGCLAAEARYEVQKSGRGRAHEAEVEVVRVGFAAQGTALVLVGAGGDGAA
jgi:hypothetical protein